MPANMPQPIPVLILTGFLGSGKTTLLNRLLADGIKTAVIINEFGGTPVDQDLLENQSIPMTVLSGGCLCCQIKGALAPTLKNLRMAWDGSTVKPFERVIIETSGIASPEPILDTLLREPWLSKRYRLRQVIATLAIPSAVEHLQRYAEAKAQAVWADTLLLTHADLAEPAQLRSLEAYLQTLAPATPILTRTLAQLDTGDLLNAPLPLFRRLPANADPIEHAFQSVSLYFEQTPDWPRLQSALQRLIVQLGPALPRIKGVVYPPDFNGPIAIQAASGRLYPATPLPPRANDDRRGRLIFIGAGPADALAETLGALFADCDPPPTLRRHSN